MARVGDLRFEPDLVECPDCPPAGCDLSCVMPPLPGDLGQCPRCRRGGGMIDLGHGLLWCEDCNLGVTDEP